MLAAILLLGYCTPAQRQTLFFIFIFLIFSLFFFSIYSAKSSLLNRPHLQKYNGHVTHVTHVTFIPSWWFIYHVDLSMGVLMALYNRVLQYYVMLCLGEPDVKHTKRTRRY